MKLIGDKSQFAIEYSIDMSVSRDANLFGRARIWIDNIYVGNVNEDDYFFSLQVELNRLSEMYQRRYNSRLLALKNSDLIDLFFEQKKRVENYDEALDMDRYLFGRGMIFDDFCMFCLFDGERLRFIWKINEKTNFAYPEYPRNALSGFVDVGVLKRVASEFSALTT